MRKTTRTHQPKTKKKNFQAFQQNGEEQKKKTTFDDLLPLFDSRSPELDGVGVVGIFGCGSGSPLAAGDTAEESENLAAESAAIDGDASSWDPGTYTQRFLPKAIFAFLHLLPIFPKDPISSKKKPKEKAPLFAQNGF